MGRKVLIEVPSLGIKERQDSWRMGMEVKLSTIYTAVCIYIFPLLPRYTNPKLNCI